MYDLQNVFSTAICDLRTSAVPGVTEVGVCQILPRSLATLVFVRWASSRANLPGILGGSARGFFCACATPAVNALVVFLLICSPFGGNFFGSVIFQSCDDLRCWAILHFSSVKLLTRTETSDPLSDETQPSSASATK